MKSTHLFLMGLLMLILTLLLIYDYFPSLNDLLYISKPVLIGLMLVIILAGFFMNRGQKADAPKLSFWLEVAVTCYLLILLIVLTAIGGVSQVGVSLSNPVVWIMLFITLYEIAKQYKKLKAGESSARVS